MIYAILLAAGTGTRLRQKQIKPLVLIKQKPVFLYTVDTFLKQSKINRIFLVVNPKYTNQYKKWLTSSIYKRVIVCDGSVQTRTQSLIKAMAFLNANYSILPTDIIITHDAARINVNSRIINDNICVAKKHGYASTVLPLADSLCQLNKTISYVSRDNKFLVQTPQTFQYKYWSSHIDNPRVTDLFTYLKLTLLTKHLVMGSNMNFKITNQNDLIFE